LASRWVSVQSPCQLFVAESQTPNPAGLPRLPGSHYVVAARDAGESLCRPASRRDSKHAAVGAGVGVPQDLTGPVEVELARAVEQIPGPKALSGGTVW
jgi:hypothetical protein